MKLCRIPRLFLIVTWLLVDLNGSRAEVPTPPQADQINLALRRTADALLRDSGDSTSRIPAVEQTAPLVWRVRMDASFLYENLPGLLQSSLDRHHVTMHYNVALRRCTDDVIDLGYHQLDWLKDTQVACQGRTTIDECHYIEVTFLEKGPTQLATSFRHTWFLWLLLGGGIATVVFILQSRKKPKATPVHGTITFGQSRLDVAGQILNCGPSKTKLTFRETKLLDLFVQHANQILERDFILQHVWADEGVLVGRSVDVFVSRLRKKLASDPSVTIASVHGVGYRLEAPTPGM